MIKELQMPVLGGTVQAISSKSRTHRLLIAAALADRPTNITCDNGGADIAATISCLEALGASCTRHADGIAVRPLSYADGPVEAALDCGESGSTLRFILPVLGALGRTAKLSRHGRLAERPLAPLCDELCRHGMIISDFTMDPLICRGKLNADTYTVAANISSQFISGLLLGLSILSAPSELQLVGTMESAPYVDMTVDVLQQFGAGISRKDNRFTVEPSRPLISPGNICSEGDWSSAAFFLTAGAIGKHPITVTGMNPVSRQGDRAIVERLRDFGATVTVNEADGTVTAHPAPLTGTHIDARQIPDLVPILAVAASVAEGETVIDGAARLRDKESDRLDSVARMLTALGGQIRQTDDGLVITGRPQLNGGRVSACGDHRIAMSAAIAATVCTAPVQVDGAQSVDKSYPGFWNDFDTLMR